MEAVDKLVPRLRAIWYKRADGAVTELTNLLVTLKYRLQGYLEEALSTFRRHPRVRLFEDARPETYVPSLFISYGLQFSKTEKVVASLKRLAEADRSVHASLRWARQQELLTELEQSWSLYRVECVKSAADAIRLYNSTHSDRLEDTLDVVTWDDLWTNRLWTSIPSDTRMTLTFPMLGKGKDGTVIPVRVSDEGLAAVTKDFSDMKHQARMLAERLMARALSFSVVEDGLVRRCIWGRAVEQEQKGADYSLRRILDDMRRIRESNFGYSMQGETKDQDALEKVAAWNRRLMGLRTGSTRLEDIRGELKRISDDVRTEFIVRRFSASSDDRFRRITNPDFVAAYWVGKYVNGPYKGNVARLSEMYAQHRRQFHDDRVYLNDVDMIPEVKESYKRYEQAMNQFQSIIRDMNVQREPDIRRSAEVQEQRKNEYRLARRHDAGNRILVALRECSGAIESKGGGGVTVDDAQSILSDFTLTFTVPRTPENGSVEQELKESEESAFAGAFGTNRVLEMWKEATGAFENAILELQWVSNALEIIFDREGVEEKMTGGFIRLASTTPILEPDSPLVKYTRALPVPKTLVGEILKVSGVHQAFVNRELTARSRSGRLASRSSYEKSVKPADRDEIVRVMLAERGNVPSTIRLSNSTEVDEKLVDTNLSEYARPKLLYRDADLLWAANDRLQTKLESERFTKLFDSNQTSFEAFVQLLYLTMVSAVISIRGAYEESSRRAGRA